MAEQRKREIQGTVLSRSGDKTVRILVERRVKHPLYHKYVRRFKKYLVHDEDNKLLVGDVVVAEECAPLSKNKAFTLKTFTRPEGVE